MTNSEISRLEPPAPIDLAHAQAFALGTARISPAIRMAQFADGEAVLEPRVMQVLTALARADGAVVSRDDLVALCWEGRAVSEDAINRVISKLRKLSERDSGGAFQIETISRVGYRLLPGAAPAGAGAPPTTPPTARAEAFDRRRAMLIGGGVLGAVTLGVGGYALWPRRRISREAQILVEQAYGALRLNEPDSTAQALGFLRQAVELAPDYADAWAALGVAYTRSMRYAPVENHANIAERSRAAYERALELDPNNRAARMGVLMRTSPYRRWGEVEAVLRDALRRDPDYIGYVGALFPVLMSVGRVREAIPVGERAIALDQLSPYPRMHLSLAYATVSRADDAERTIDAARALWPRHFGVWFTRFWLWTFSGQGARAEAMAQDRAARPLGIPDWNFDACAETAHAFATGAARDRQRALDVNRDMAHRGYGFALNAVLVFSALGELDGAFEIADGYFFDRGFAISDYAYSAEQEVVQQRDDRTTAFLFGYPTQTLRADPRFERLAEEIGLAAYWRDARVTPDYKRER